MQPKRVQCLFFSPCGSVKAYAIAVSEAAAQAAGLPLQLMDLTLPAARQQPLSFAPDTLTVAAFPVYAGRLPNRLLPDLNRLLSGGCGPAVALAVLLMTAGVSTGIPLGWFAALFGFSLLVGGLFGVYPALKASRLPPVEALRSE